MVLGAMRYTVTREDEAGSWSAGKYVPGVTSTFEIDGCVQPLERKQIEALPEKASTKAKFILYCANDQPELKVTDLALSVRGDRIEVDGTEFVLMAWEDWHRHTTGLPHRAYVLLEVAADE